MHAKEDGERENDKDIPSIYSTWLLPALGLHSHGENDKYLVYV